MNKDTKEFLQAVGGGLLLSIPLVLGIVVPFIIVLWVVVGGI